MVLQLILFPELDALNLSPAKKQVSKKWSYIKTHTVEKLLRGRQSVNSPTSYSTPRVEQREVIHIRPRRLFSERLPSSSTSCKDKDNDWSPEKVEQFVKDSNEESQVVPKMRKKRAAPRPPSAILNSDPENSIDTWNEIEHNMQQVLDEKEVTEYISAPNVLCQMNCEIQKAVVDGNKTSPSKEESNETLSCNVIV